MTMPIRILIADDHAIFRSGLKVLLEQEKDIQVVAEAGSGWDTLSAVDSHQIDVLVLDIGMPGLSGPRVAELVLQKKPELAIVVLTMYDEEYYVRELLKIGARAVVFKKSTGSDIIKAIRAAHAGGRYIDSSIIDQVIKSYAGVPEKKKEEAAPPNILTQREREIVGLLAYGHTNGEIAKKLNISEKTVQTHRRNIMSKLRIKGRAELVTFAIENGFFKQDSTPVK